MERIKNLIVMCIYIALTVLVCSYIPSFFPVSEVATQAYTHMQEQYQKISDGSSIDPEAMKNLVSEEEFKDGLSADTVRERANTLLQETSNFTYIYGEEELGKVADEMKSIYEAEQDIAKDTKRAEVLGKIRMYSGIVLGLSVVIVGLIMFMQKKKKASVRKSKTTLNA